MGPAPAVALGVAVLVVSPWVVRNDVSVGCFAITTDARALWKANNEHTLETLRAGKWIDDVPLEGTPLSPQDAHAIYERTGRVVRVDECAQMRFYREKAFDFMRDHPGEKAKLGAYGAKLLATVGLPDGGTPGQGHVARPRPRCRRARLHGPRHAFALYGLALLPRHFLVLTLALLAYQTVMAILFVGATRYRVPWDFLVMIPAAAGAVRLLQLVPATRASARPGH